MDDVISRQQAIDAMEEYFARIGKLKRRGLNKGEKAIALDTVGAIKSLPSAQPDIIRCKDCKWWDRYNDYKGYCMAAKSCTYTTHWDIQIRRTYDGDFYCAHAEPKEEYEEGEDE